MDADANEIARKQLLRRSLTSALVLCVGTAIFVGQWRTPFVRFASGAANEIVGFGLALALPWWAAIELVRTRRWWGNTIVILAFLPLLLYSCLALLSLAMDTSGGFERFAEVQWRG